MSYETGLQAEDLAKRYLLKQGLKWIKTHHRSRFGEIDLIMQDKDCLVFVEVRFRKSSDFGPAYESVNRHKQRKLKLTALQYLAYTKAHRHLNARFDVVGLQGEPPQIEWIQNAFEVSGQ